MTPPLTPPPPVQVQWRFPTTFEGLEAAIPSAAMAIELVRNTLNSGRRDKEGAETKANAILREAGKAIAPRRPKRE